MKRYHDNCFSRFPRTSSSDPSRSADVLAGPFSAPRSPLSILIDAVLWAASVGLLAAIVFMPRVIEFLGISFG